MSGLKETDWLIRFDSGKLGYGNVVIQNNHVGDNGIKHGVTAVFGKNGSGKTTLGTVLEKGRYAYGNRLVFFKPNLKVKMLSFSDIHTLTGMEVSYSAQRMEATMNDFVPTVSDLLGNRIHSAKWKEYTLRLNLHNVSDKKLNFLSSGELRKLIIINALCSNPDLLILDNPYIGLDSASRIELNKAIEDLKNDGVSIVLLVCDPADIPPSTDYLIEINNLGIGQPIKISDHKLLTENVSTDIESDLDFCGKDSKNDDKDFSIAFEIKEGHIRYGEKRILENFNWQVLKGERWVLTGPNGSGKSLLLSMICADNPQGYSNDIILFDKKRGSGESIWEIKRHIGYVSPEMQLFFKSVQTVSEIVIQGLRDALNLYAKPTEEEKKLADNWLMALGIHKLRDRKFHDLSAGEQRLVLLARAMIKCPDLLVLDEPLHGLDSQNKYRVNEIINSITRKTGMTLILVTHYKEEIPECVDHVKEIIGNP